MDRIAGFVIMLMAATATLPATAQNAADGDGTTRQVVLLEEFTNTGCAPCAVFGPKLDALLDRRFDDIVAVKYHSNYPDRSDPYYLNEPEDAGARSTFYGVTGVPTVIVNGTRIAGDTAMISLYADTEPAKQSRIGIMVKATLTDHRLHVSTELTPAEDIAADDLRLFTVVTEDYNHFDKAMPNGEKDFRNVMQKILPDGNGRPLGRELTAGNTGRYEDDWTVEHFYDETQLAIVSFVQDIQTQAIIGAAYTPYPTGSDDAAKVIAVSGTPDYICSPRFTSDIVIRCTGRNGLRSANINVGINGSVQSTPWQGSLDYLERAAVRTPEFTDFALSAAGTANEAEIWLSDINGTGEESPRWAVTLHNAARAINAARLTIMTDNKPQETTWQLLASDGRIVCEGGPYEQARTKYVKVLPLDVDDCYTIEFHDSGNDGINGAAGAGYYKLDQLTADGKSKMLKQATYESGYHAEHFSLEQADATAGIGSITEEKGKAPADIYTIGGIRLGQAGGKRANGVLIIKEHGTDSPATKKIYSK